MTSLTTALTGTGVMIRYSFYFVGLLVFGMIGIGIHSLFGLRTRVVDEKVSFHVAASHLSRLPMRQQIVTGGLLGRMELVQYGAVHNRDINLSIGMGFPPSGALITADTVPQIHHLMPRNMRYSMTSNYHDLETRFGSMRATEFRVDSDGQWKQCLAFASRFDTTAIYLVGWYCDASGAKPSAGSLACTLDKFTLDRDMSSASANAFMRARMQRPGSCSAIPVSQTTDTRYRTQPSSPSKWSQPSSTYRRY